VTTSVDAPRAHLDRAGVEFASNKGIIYGHRARYIYAFLDAIPSSRSSPCSSLDY